ncbi:MAG: hypothetical protein ACYSWS_12020 [Planctomycetota bacterium]|jgi:hypothetical protein
MGDKREQTDNLVYKSHIKRFNKRLEKALNKLPEEIRSEDEQRPAIYAARRKVADKLKKDVNEAGHYLDQYLAKLLSQNSGTFSKKEWTRGNKKIRDNLEKKKHKYLLSILDYLCTHTFSMNKSRVEGDKIGAGVYETKTKKGESEERIYVLIQIDKETIGIKFGISSSAVQKYVKEMERVGIIKKLGRDGSRGKALYALGTFYIWRDEEEDYKEKPKRLWFLNKETCEMLLEFNIG